MDGFLIHRNKKVRISVGRIKYMMTAGEIQIIYFAVLNAHSSSGDLPVSLAAASALPVSARATITYSDTTNVE